MFDLRWKCRPTYRLEENLGNGMYVTTAQSTLLAMHPENGSFTQINDINNLGDNRLVEMDKIEVTALEVAAQIGGKQGILVESGPFSGYRYLKAPGERAFNLFKVGYGYVCVPPNMAPVANDRSAAAEWETLHFIAPEAAGAFLRIRDQGEEAFAARVATLSASNAPVLLHVGCGPKRLKGFLNLDKYSNFGDPEDYFLFDYAENPWPIPDSSVDYIYSEDFIEHIPQRNQIGFLAEAFRVLKPNCFHRVSTPCLIDSMRRHSDFSKGHKGVYFGEFDKWDHICLFTRGLMTELANVIGYRQVFFTTKSHGSSAYAVPDSRPDLDRDDLTGNIFADLLK